MRNLCDVNVLLAATVDVHPHHQTARNWFAALGPADTAELCRITQSSFLRLLTTRIAEHYTPISKRR
jgi:predicted nucleic acid-binding protein